MHLYIKEWADDTATLMTESGHVLCVFPSIEEAQSSCLEDYSLEDLLDAYHQENTKPV
jgi:hypothetical protein